MGLNASNAATQFTPVTLFAPHAAASGTSPGLDLQAYSGDGYIFLTFTKTSGTISAVYKAQECDTSNGSPTDIAGLPTVTLTATGEGSIRIRKDMVKRWLFLNEAQGGTNPVGITSASVRSPTMRST